MKKLLALVLALVMTLSLCITSNAAFAGEEYDYDEAVEVMAAAGVFQGDENGKFNGKAELTREQAAKLIAYLDLGEKVAEALPAVKVFNDVAADRWSAKYVAYCADAGYINGVGNGNFEPDGKLTGYAFGKMLLCVLGYDAKIEAFTGSNWSIAVAKLMQSNKITKGADGSASATLTREQAAQYCLNALKATMVEYHDRGTEISINGAVISTGASKTNDVAQGDYRDIFGKAATLQLAEKLYDKKLSLKDDANDSFGRPAVKWTWTEDGKATTIGTYASTADYKTVITKFYDNADKLIDGIADNLDLDVEDFDVDDTAIYFNGVSGDAYREAEDCTRAEAEAAMAEFINNPGTVVELFLDSDDDSVITTLVAYNYALVKVAAVHKNDAESDEVTKYGMNKEYDLKTVLVEGDIDLNNPLDEAYTYVDAKNQKAKDKSDYDEYQAIGDYAKGDKFVAIANPLTGKILAQYDVKTVEGKITAADNGYVKVDGEKYVSYLCEFGTADFTNTYAFTLDPNGNIIAAKQVTDEATGKYFYVKAAELTSAKLTSAPTAAIKVMNTDGSIEVLDYEMVKATKTTTVETYDTDKTTVDKGDYYFNYEGNKYAAKTFETTVTKNEWATYDVKSNGAVVINDMDDDDKAFVEDSVSAGSDAKTVCDGIYADKSTVVTVFNSDGTVKKTVTGYSKFPTSAITGTGLVVLTKDYSASGTNTAANVYIVEGSVSNDTTVGVLLALGEYVEDGRMATYFVDGAKKDYLVSDDDLGNYDTLGVAYELEIDEDGEVVDITRVDFEVYGQLVVAGDGYVVVDDDPTDATIDLADDCDIYQVAKNYKSASVVELSSDFEDWYTLVITNDDDEATTVIFYNENSTGVDALYGN